MHIADEGIRSDATLEGIRGVKLLREGGRITAARAARSATAPAVCSSSTIAV
jgi:acetyl-CoA C-acetyltransferase